VTEAQAIELISATFAAQWPTLSGQVPFALENRSRPSADTFAALTTVTSTSDQRTMGGVGTRFVERQGWVVVKLWGPAGAGRLGLATLTEAVRGIFEMKALPAVDGGEPLSTYATATMAIGTDGRWFMQLARTPFSFFETK